MRPSLLHPISERHTRRAHRWRRATPAPESDATVHAPGSAPREPDSATQRVREAGGPTDRASYACQCGYLFAAAVSTTVECPHCGTPQAW
jgi:rubrerythrin